MSRENVEVVRAMLEAGARGDIESFITALDPAIEWTPVPDDPDYRVHRALDDVVAWLTDWLEVFPDMHWEAERIIDAGDELVVAVVRALGRGDAMGAEVGTQTYGVVFTIRSGKIVRIVEAETATAFEIAGIEP